MDRLEVAHRRLHNQHLSGARLADPVAVVAHLGAMQAQEYAVATWSVGQRSREPNATSVRRAVDSGAILRTHVLRPTWHVVAGVDLGWVQALTSPRVHALNAYYYRQVGVDDELVAKTNAVITGALRGENHLTRKEVGEALAKAGVVATGTRLAYVLMRAELGGLIASGATRGTHHTYALLSEQVPNPHILAPEEALAELTRRYFTSHGPATVKDFAWWSSLTAAQIRRGLDLVGSALERDEIDGRTYWFAPASPPRRDPSPTAYVLQAYDEYMISYTESRSVTNLAGFTVDAADTRTLIHSIVLDSQLAGFWRRVVGRAGITAEVTLVDGLAPPQRRAVEAAFAHYADFARMPVAVQW